MAALVIENASKSFGETQVLRDVSLDVADGEFCVIVGPRDAASRPCCAPSPGSTNSTAGASPSANGRSNGLPPAERGIAMVFQSYALYPHLSRATRIWRSRCGSRSAPRPRSTRRCAAPQASSGSSNCSSASQRRCRADSASASRSAAPSSASPRCSCSTSPCRTSTPRCAMRMRFEFAALHQTLRHDHGLRHPRPGRSDDAGRPHRRHARRPDRADRHPDRALRAARQPFVAGFLGSPQMNFLSGEVVERRRPRARVRTASGERIALPPRCAKASARPGNARIGVRPEHLAGRPTRPRPRPRAAIHRAARRQRQHPPSRRRRGRRRPAGVAARRAGGISEGERIALTPDPQHIHLFDAGGAATARV